MRKWSLIAKALLLFAVLVPFLPFVCPGVCTSWAIGLSTVLASIAASLLVYSNLYLQKKALGEQQNESYRRGFESSFGRRLKAMLAYIEKNKDFLKGTYNKIQTIDEENNPFAEVSSKDKAICSLGNSYYAETSGGSDFDSIQNLCNYFDDITTQITQDEKLNTQEKSTYLKDFESLIPEEAVVAIICYSCHEKELERIELMAKEKLFKRISVKADGFEYAKDILLGYPAKKTATIDMSEMQLDVQAIEPKTFL